MNAKVIIVKSFDEGKEYEKELERGDLKEFFEEEGDYLERLSDMMRSHAQPGESFTVAYSVKVTR